MSAEAERLEDGFGVQCSPTSSSPDHVYFSGSERMGAMVRGKACLHVEMFSFSCVFANQVGLGGTTSTLQ